MNGYTTALRRYAEFGGRSRRAEYWGFTIINVVIVTVVYVIALTAGRDGDGFTGIGFLALGALAIYGLATLIPRVALDWRRYQDIGWAGPLSIIGWFIPLLTFIVAFIPGNAGRNEYGEDPKL